jgi:hypothetical protein
MPVKLNSTGGGSVTLTTPSTASDFTVTIPAATGTVNMSGLVNEVPVGSASAPSIYSTGDTNTGVFFPTADTVALTTGGTERMRIDSSGNLLFNSGYGSVATAYGCRAWVNFNGTGTVAIRASGNVSSITDFATGDYQVNITNAMPDANYAFQVAAQRNSAGANIAVAAGQGSSLYQTASTFRVLTYNSAFVSEDPQAVLCAVFR